MDLHERFNRLDLFIAEKRLIRKAWTGENNQTACLLAALSPETGEQETAAVCPASLMPRWLAELTPWIDDAGSDTAWLSVVKRYATLARRWHVLEPEAWRRLDYQVRALSVREAMSHTQEQYAIDVCTRVEVLCELAASGSDIAVEQWSAAESAAES